MFRIFASESHADEGLVSVGWFVKLIGVTRWLAADEGQDQCLCVAVDTGGTWYGGVPSWCCGPLDTTGRARYVQNTWSAREFL
jgi:hypothetical protein